MPIKTRAGQIWDFCAHELRLAEEGACDAYPREGTAGAKQLRMQFRAGALSAILGASARTALGHDRLPA
jgi:hypothetical protein